MISDKTKAEVGKHRSQLESRLRARKGELAEYKQIVTRLKAEIVELESTIEALETDIPQLEVAEWISPQG